jgi:hypothetical protein
LMTLMKHLDNIGLNGRVVDCKGQYNVSRKLANVETKPGPNCRPITSRQ